MDEIELNDLFHIIDWLKYSLPEDEKYSKLILAILSKRLFDPNEKIHSRIYGGYLDLMDKIV